MKSQIVPNKTPKLANSILKEYSPRQSIGVQGITAHPEFLSTDKYVLRTDIHAAFEHVTKELSDKYVFPKWIYPEEYSDIILSEYNQTFSRGVLIIGSSLSPRIFEDFMDAIGLPQINTIGTSKMYRYVDDIILFNTDKEAILSDFALLGNILTQFGFIFSTEKTQLIQPGEEYSFLGREFRAKTEHIAYPSFASDLPSVVYTDDASTERDGTLYLNKRYLKEFYTSTTLNGYISAINQEVATGKPLDVEYDQYLGHSRIYNFYLKNIKRVYESGITPDIRKAKTVLIALAVHLRYQAGKLTTPITEWLKELEIDIDCAKDARKNTPYHKTIRRLFKQEYAFRNPK